MAAKAKIFSYLDAIKFGFSSFFEHFVTLFLAFLTNFLITIIGFVSVAGILFWEFRTKIKSLAFFKQLDKTQIFALISENTIFVLIMIFIFWFLILSLHLGIIKIGFNIFDKDKAEYETMFSMFHLAFKAMVVVFLYGLLISVGLAFFVVPGIYFLIKYVFAIKVLVDKECSVLQAFSQSAKITKGFMWHLLFFMVLTSLLSNILSYTVVGAIFAYIPFTLAWIYAYKKLK